jgi:uncharacterized membrane protein
VVTLRRIVYGGNGAAALRNISASSSGMAAIAFALARAALTRQSAVRRTARDAVQTSFGEISDAVAAAFGAWRGVRRPSAAYARKHRGA